MSLLLDLLWGASLTTYQQRVRKWMLACFGNAILVDETERNCRFLEEALELVQACNMTKEQAETVLNYVFSRDPGIKDQEAGGVMVCLSALCTMQSIRLDEAAFKELNRIEEVDTMERIRLKQRNKPAAVRGDSIAERR